MKNKIKISCLPDAGIENPYQYLMMEGLKKNQQLEVVHGVDGRFFCFLRTYLKQKPDFIHLDWTNKYFNRTKTWMVYFNIPILFIELFILKYFTRVQMVWTMHNLIPHDIGNNKVKFFARKMIARSFKWIRVFDEGTIDKAAALYKIEKNKFKVLPEGSYLGYYPNNSTKETARKNFNIADDETVFLFIGLIRPYKGVLEAIQEIKKNNYYKWKFIIAGRCKDKQYFEQIKNAIGSDQRILFNEGFVPAENLHIYYNASDFVLLPFKNIENSGSVILSMGFKKIIIAPKMGVLNTRLKQQAKFLYQESFTEILETINKTSQEEKELIGKNNFNELNKYSWEDFSVLFLNKINDQ